jgi:hypothetical protein
MSQKPILDEPLYSTTKKFEFAFSIEGILVIILILSLYLGYYFSITAEQALGMYGQIWFLFAHFLLIFWQVLGNLIVLTEKKHYWRELHFKMCFVAGFFNLLVLFLNYGNDWGFLWIFSILLIPHFLSWAYVFICFLVLKPINK